MLFNTIQGASYAGILPIYVTIIFTNIYT